MLDFATAVKWLTCDSIFALVVVIVWLTASTPSLQQIPLSDDASCRFEDPVDWIRVDTDTHLFVDGSGRTRLFHGVNVVFKQPPFLPDSDKWDPYLSFSQRDAEDLRLWGFNMIRLGVLWAGTFPSGPDRPDPAYMEAVSRIVSLCAAEGIYVIVDLHTDSLSRRFCGNGFPDWAIDVALNSSHFSRPDGGFPAPVADPDTFFPHGSCSGEACPPAWQDNALAANAITAVEVAAVNADLYPNLTACLDHPDFFDFNWAYANTYSVEALYRNTSGLWNGFGTHWRSVAQTLRDHPNILMYELLNEPLPGNIYKYKIPYHYWINAPAEERDLQGPLYRDAARRIREVDPRHIICFEPIVWNFWPAITEPLVADGLDREAVCWHSYWHLIHHSGRPYYELAFAAMGQTLRARGGGSFLTEYGSVGNTSFELVDIRRVQEVADSHLSSRAYWQYKNYKDITSSGGLDRLSFYPHGELQSEKLNALATPYAQATGGRLHSMSFDLDTSVFNMEFTGAPANHTSIHLGPPQVHYPHGFIVYANRKLSLCANGSNLRLSHSAALVGESIRVCVLPCVGADCSSDPSVWYLAWHCRPSFLWNQGVSAVLFVSTAFLLQVVLTNFLTTGEYACFVKVDDAQTRWESQALSVLMAVVSGTFASAGVICLGLPFHDELWRWLVAFTMPLLLVVAGKIQHSAPPAFFALCVALLILWRVTYCVLDPFLQHDTLLSLVVRASVMFGVLAGRQTLLRRSHHCPRCAGPDDADDFSTDALQRRSVPLL